MEDFTITFLVFITAIMYASVGHAGASGYLAVMALFGLAPEAMRPTALVLNIVVAGLTTYKYSKAGQNNLRLLSPFIITSIPAAFIGGTLNLPTNIFKLIIGFILLISAVYFLFTAKKSVITDSITTKPKLTISLLTGGIIGFLAGISGTGGGIFLSPILILMRWSSIRTVSGIAASFILVNSISGLAGTTFSYDVLPQNLPALIVAVLLGGFIGTYLGTKKLSITGIRYLLALVQIIAGIKMIITA